MWAAWMGRSSVDERTCVREDHVTSESAVEELLTLSESALRDRIEALELRRRATEAELAAAVSVASGRGLHAADGHRSMTG